MSIKTFRGLLAHGLQETIHLHTNDGSTGYKIKKFQLIYEAPGKDPQDVEFIGKIYKTEQTTIDGLIDFSDQRLLGVVFYQSGNTSTEQAASTIIFDSETFNQDIYVTMHENAAGGSLRANWYIELEQVKLDLNENTVATLKDIRNITAPT